MYANRCGEGEQKRVGPLGVPEDMQINPQSTLSPHMSREREWSSSYGMNCNQRTGCVRR